MNTRPLFGYDRHMRSIHDGCIVSFRERSSSRKRVGHIWQGTDWMSDDESAKCWVISYNHCGSETSDPASVGHHFRVIGDVKLNPDDEELLNLDYGCPNRFEHQSVRVRP